MLRLSPPTRRTFLISATAIVIGVVLWLDLAGLDVDPEVAYWMTAGGAAFLLIGNLFNRL